MITYLTTPSATQQYTGNPRANRTLPEPNRQSRREQEQCYEIQHTGAQAKYNHL